MCKWIWEKQKAIYSNSSARFATIGFLIIATVAFMAIFVAEWDVCQMTFAIIGGLLFILTIVLTYVWLKNPLSTSYAKKEDIDEMKVELAGKVDKVIDLLSKGKRG